MGLVLLEMHIGAAVRESQYITIFHISLDIFSTSVEISYVYCLLYLPLHEVKILKLRKFHAKEKCTVKLRLTVSYLFSTLEFSCN